VEIEEGINEEPPISLSIEVECHPVPDTRSLPTSILANYLEIPYASLVGYGMTVPELT
jgi:hypothetical protein